MAYNHENVIVGAADLFWAPVRVANPDYVDEDTTPTEPRFIPTPLPALTPGTSARTPFLTAETAGWRHVGLTSGGVEVTYAPDYGEVEVDQFLDVAKMFKQRQSVTVATTLAEATLDNLVLAWGQADSTLDRAADADADNGIGAGDDVLTIHGGSLGERPQERRLAFIGPAPVTDDGEPRERVYVLNRVLSVESSAHGLNRNDATQIPVSLRCLPEADDTSGEVTYGYIIQRRTT